MLLFLTDTAAVSILAQVCLKKMTLTPKVKKEIRESVEQLVQKIMTHSHNGVLGNMYSTGLAMQALTVSGIQWNCRESLKMILDQIPKGTFDLPMTASQIIPSLEGQTYLNVIGLNCSADKDDIIPTPSPPTRPRLIHVRYTISAKVKIFIKGTITVHVPWGSTFFDVMKVAMEKKCKIFRFTYENSSWGPYITSVQGLMADDNQRTYWQLLSGNIPLDRGAGNYIVSDKERLEALTVSGIQWNCRESLKMILDQIHKGTFDLPMAASQIIPSLEGRTYLNVTGLNCSADKDDLDIITTTPSPPTSPPPCICVNYTVSAKVKTFINGTIPVHVPQGSSLFDVMKVAQDKNWNIFRYPAGMANPAYAVGVFGSVGQPAAQGQWGNGPKHCAVS
ncbi:gastric intrinsic factor-like [Alligator mississippiensis]|uniref:Gastric intrinsic factor-like n=1 Tax=Alligator mississippiensis TaxID=8496 RepID=A0A151NY32_ALLMI|nr:gastric intrinsic factor-like [Alligator mississippiensis]